MHTHTHAPTSQTHTVYTDTQKHTHPNTHIHTLLTDTHHPLTHRHPPTCTFLHTHPPTPAGRRENTRARTRTLTHTHPLPLPPALTADLLLWLPPEGGSPLPSPPRRGGRGGPGAPLGSASPNPAGSRAPDAPRLVPATAVPPTRCRRCGAARPRSRPQRWPQASGPAGLRLRAPSRGAASWLRASLPGRGARAGLRGSRAPTARPPAALPASCAPAPPARPLPPPTRPAARGPPPTRPAGGRAPQPRAAAASVPASPRALIHPALLPSRGGRRILSLARAASRTLPGWPIIHVHSHTLLGKHRGPEHPAHTRVRAHTRARTHPRHPTQDGTPRPRPLARTTTFIKP